MSLGLLLTIIFVVLKVTGVVNWTVLTLFVPIIVEFALYVVFGVIALGLAVTAAVLGSK